MDRSTYDKMKYGNFYLLIGILLVFILNQSANDNRAKKAETKPKINYPYQCQISEKNMPTNFQSCIV